MTHSSISPDALYERIRTGEPVDLIDVRSPGEFEKMHAVGARLVPLDTLNRDAVLAGRTGSPDRPVYVICQSDSRSLAACARLTQEGLDNVVRVEGGTAAWKRAGLPVEGADGAGPGRWLRTAGLLGAAAALLLAITVHPGFAFAAAGIWLALLLTGNAPCCCCSSGSCSIPRKL